MALKRWVALGKCAEVEGLRKLDLSNHKEVIAADAEALGDLLASPNATLTELKYFASPMLCSLPDISSLEQSHYFTCRYICTGCTKTKWMSSTLRVFTV